MILSNCHFHLNRMTNFAFACLVDKFDPGEAGGHDVDPVSAPGADDVGKSS